MSLRRRNDLSSKSDRRDSSVCDDDKKMMSRMSSQLRRLFTPYKLLILFIVIVFILQVIVGISFFHTVSHRFKWVKWKKCGNTLWQNVIFRPQAALSESKPNVLDQATVEDPGSSQSKVTQSHNLYSGIDRRDFSWRRHNLKFSCNITAKVSCDVSILDLLDTW